MVTVTVTDCGDGGSGSAPTPTNPLKGPCPGRGYSCDCCLDGFFCPPKETPARPAPCGYGWPCYDCPGGWFCVPSPGADCPSTGAANPAGTAPLAVSPPAVSPGGAGAGPGSGPKGPADYPTITSTITTVQTVTATVPGPYQQPPRPLDNKLQWQYLGCYHDESGTALRGASTASSPPDMSNNQCIEYCQSSGFSISGTRDGGQCYCGNEMYETWLTDDADCNVPCASDAEDLCGGPAAIGVYSSSRDIAIVPKPFAFTPPAGASAWSLHTGGASARTLVITTNVYAWPAHNPLVSESYNQPAVSTTAAGAPHPAAASSRPCDTTPILAPSSKPNPIPAVPATTISPSTPTAAPAPSAPSPAPAPQPASSPNPGQSPGRIPGYGGNHARRWDNHAPEARLREARLRAARLREAISRQDKDREAHQVRERAHSRRRRTHRVIPNRP